MKFTIPLNNHFFCFFLVCSLIRTVTIACYLIKFSWLQSAFGLLQSVHVTFSCKNDILEVIAQLVQIP